MNGAARWTGGVALLATLCGGAVGLGAERQGAQGAHIAEVIVIGPASAWTHPLSRDCLAESPADTSVLPLAVLRYRDGSRYERRWRTARVAAPAGARVGDHLLFDASACSVSAGE